MKKKLNLFCVLILVLKAAQIVVGNVMSFGENAQAFHQGWEEGGKADASIGFEFWGRTVHRDVRTCLSLPDYPFAHCFRQIHLKR